MSADALTRFWEAVRRYGAAESLRATARVTIESALTGTTWRDRVTIETHWRRPGRVCVLAGADGFDQSGVICDGEMVQFRMDQLSLVITAPAPRDADGLARCLTYHDGLVSSLEFGPPPVSVLAFCLGQLDPVSADLSPGYDAGNPWFAEFGKGVDAEAVTLRFGGLTAVYWIDAHGQIPRLAWEGTSLAELEALETVEPRIGVLAIRDGMEQYLLRHAVSYEHQAINDPLDDTVFEYRPSEGHQVTRLSRLVWGDLATAALYGPLRRAQESPAPGRKTGR